jgi:succinoglycan biosynthesis protein ExoV
MRLHYHVCEQPNFGDELNPFLWPRLLPGLLDDDPDQMLVGIGTLLKDSMPRAPRMVVMGTGVGYGAPPALDSRFDVRFVRGPRSAAALGLPAELGVGDGAILLRTIDLPRPEKRYRFGFMPHWESLLRGPWPMAAAAADMHLIDPRNDVPDVLEQILATEVMVCEAMHGAIVADALRVPWIALRPIDPDHHDKWLDWAGALGIELRRHELAPSSLYEQLAVRHRWGRRGRLVSASRPLLDRFAAGPIERAARSLRRAAAAEPQLSADGAIARATERMQSEVAALLRESVPG